MTRALMYGSAHSRSVMTKSADGGEHERDREQDRPGRVCSVAVTAKTMPVIVDENASHAE